MSRYILIEDASGQAPPFAGERGVRLRAAGKLSGSQVAVSVTDLDPNDVAEARRSPRTLGLSQTMPVRLIAPKVLSDEVEMPADATATGARATWGLDAVGAPTAHAAGITGAGVTVAVLDTGLDASHPAFAHLTPSQRDFVDRNAPPNTAHDANGHGTHCAGTIFGRHPEQNIAVAPGVTDVLIGRILDAKGFGDSGWMIEALQWAQQQGANIVSMSVGFDFPGYAEQLQKDGWPAALAASNALEAYRQNLRLFDSLMGLFRSQSGMQFTPLVIAAAGNESQRDTDPRFRIAASLPSAAQDVVSVAALSQAADGFAVANFSNTLATVSAPGVGVLSARAGGGYRLQSGTSMACPHAAGVAALWWDACLQAGRDPTPAMVQRRMLVGCRFGNLGAAATDRADVGEGLVQAPTTVSSL